MGLSGAQQHRLIWGVSRLAAMHVAFEIFFILRLLHDFAEESGYVALKQAAEDREGWRQRKEVRNLLYSRRLLTGHRLAARKSFLAITVKWYLSVTLPKQQCRQYCTKPLTL